MALIKEALERDHALHSLSVLCDSVHAFQGREVDICIYSVCRNNAHRNQGFLTDERLINVAASRAKWKLVFVGSSKHCESRTENTPLSDVLAFIRNDSRCAIKQDSQDD